MCQSRMGAGVSKVDSKKQVDFLNSLFRSLYKNTDSIDMSKLQDPQLCKRYVFLLQRTINDVREAAKNNELKTFVLESTDEMARETFERALYFTSHQKTVPESDLCREIAIFSLQLIFLMYCIVLSTNEVVDIPTAGVQRGGGDPIIGLGNYLAEKGFKKPNVSSEDKRNLFMIAKNVVIEIPATTTLTRVPYVFVYSESTSTVASIYMVNISGIDENNFNMSFFKCPRSGACTATSSRLVLRGVASIVKVPEDGTRFNFYTSASVMQIYGKDPSKTSLTMGEMGELLSKIAGYSDDQLRSIAAVIETAPILRATTAATLGRIAPLSPLEAAKPVFNIIANEFKSTMEKNTRSLFDIRHRQLTPAGARMQEYVTNMNTDGIKRCVEILSQGISHFRSAPTSPVELRDLLNDWNSIRTANENRFKNQVNRLGDLSEDRVKLINNAKKSLEAKQNEFTRKIADFVERNLVYFDKDKIRIRDDFFLVRDVKLSTNKKLNIVVEDACKLILRHYIDLERLAEAGFNAALSYRV